MIISVSSLGLTHRGEPMIEIDTEERLVLTYYRGMECFINYWPLDELDSRTRSKIERGIRREYRTLPHSPLVT